MIVCVSPSSQHYDETHNTLKYANRAKNIKTKVSRNIINVNRHVSEYVKMIYNLRQEVDSLKARLKDSTKEATTQLNKSRTAREASIKDGLKRIRTAFEQTKPVREEKVQMLQGLRLIERRITMVTSWLAAFDQAFASRQDQEPPAILLTMRAEADKVLRELHQNEQLVKQRLSGGQSWERAIDTAMQNSLRNLQAIEGVSEADISLLTTEANLLRITGERDVLHAVSAAEIDISTSIQTLTKAHFETHAAIGKLMTHNFSDEEALEVARKSLFNIQQTAGDAVSTVVKPSGELVSAEVYRPPAYTPPRKKKHSLLPSPVKVSQVPVLSPLRSPQHKTPIKMKSPKKGVTFHKKHVEKKRVRWNEEQLEEADDNSQRSRFVMDDYFYTAGEADGDEEDEEEDDEEEMEEEPQQQFRQMTAPPIRPRNNLVGRSLARQPNDQVMPTTTTTTTTNHGASHHHHHPRRPGNLTRKSLAGTSSSSSSSAHEKRRSPTSSSRHPGPAGQENNAWPQGILKRMPKSEKERSGAAGSVASVLSPRSRGVRSVAQNRRSTVAQVDLKALALAGYKVGGEPKRGR
jgi:kinesin family protein 18/19